MGNEDTIQVLQGLVKKNDPNCIFLMDTKCIRNKIEKKIGYLGFHKFDIVEPIALAEGLVLMWKKDMKLRVVWSTHEIIYGKVTNCAGLDR